MRRPGEAMGRGCPERAGRRGDRQDLPGTRSGTPGSTPSRRAVRIAFSRSSGRRQGDAPRGRDQRRGPPRGRPIARPAAATRRAPASRVPIRPPRERGARLRGHRQQLGGAPLLRPFVDLRRPSASRASPAGPSSGTRGGRPARARAPAAGSARTPPRPRSGSPTITSACTATPGMAARARAHDPRVVVRSGSGGPSAAARRRRPTGAAGGGAAASAAPPRPRSRAARRPRAGARSS